MNRLSIDQRDAVKVAINIIDAMSNGQSPASFDLGLGQVADLLTELLMQDDPENAPEPYSYERDAMNRIKAVIRRHPEFDINELLYNADEVAEQVSDIIFNDESENWENDRIRQDVLHPETAKQREFDARDRVCENIDICENAVYESCMDYDEICNLFFANDWQVIDLITLRHVASDFDVIKRAIDEFTKEVEA